MNRREFARSVVGAVAALTAACRDRSTSPHGEAPAGDSGLWDCVRDALKALEASPDHLAAQAKKMVATGDPKRIAAWVRDNITVLPPVAAGAYGPTTQLWGARATMRSGEGSARDSADLLAGLLSDAGFKARVMAWKRPASITAEALYREHELVFAPDVTLLAPLLERAKRSPKLETAPDHEVAKACQQLADALLASADEQLLSRARPIDGAMPDTLPIVEYERDGKKGWAIAYGTWDAVTAAPDGLGGVAGDADARNVKLTVSVAVNPPARSTIDRTVPHEVLSAKWPVAAVAGRQIAIGFVPPHDARPYLLGALDPRKESKRIAAARLIAGEPLAASEGALVVQGQLLSLGGEVDGAPPSAPRKTGPAAPQRKTVTAIELHASATAFPTVTLDVALADASGKAVDGLTDADFVVTEDGKPQEISVIRDTVGEGIRVLVMYDTSGSITASWGSAAKRAAFETQLAKQLADASSRSPFLLQIIGLSDTPTKTAWSAPDADQIKTRLAGIGSLSDVWSALGEAAPKSGASAVIVVSDFASGLEDASKIPTYQHDLKTSGIPLVIFPIGKVDRKATQLIHELSGCEEIAQNDPTAADKLASFVEATVKQAAKINYVLAYQAPAQGSAKRAIEVSVKDAAAHAVKAEYTVPAVADRAAPAGIAGVYLTLEIAGRSASRTLAGVPLSYRGTVGETSDAKAIDEATRVINGLLTIAFEPARPTTSAILHEGLTRMLTLQPIFAKGKRPMSELVPQLLQVQRFEPTLGMLLEDVPDLGGAVPDGVRALVIADTSDGKKALRTLDLMSEFNTWHGRDPDPKKAFRAALRRSLASSVREGRLFEHSATRDLSTGPWVWVAPNADGATVETLSPASKAWLHAFGDLYGGNIRLLRPQHPTGGAWVIDPASGSITAVDADGRGGVKCQMPDEAALVVALAFLSAVCLYKAPDAGQGFLVCTGADVYGAATTAAASFNTPVPSLAAADAAFLLYAGQVAAGGVDGALARGLIGVILAMLSIGAAACT